jgi:hypothetical protein
MISGDRKKKNNVREGLLCVHQATLMFQLDLGMIIAAGSEKRPISQTEKSAESLLCNSKTTQ